jgi:peptidoglycan/LPS O-acetylase OafA/YrhL
MSHSDWLTRFLSARFFVHVNKLTYAIYLLNPLIITLVFGISDNSVHADPVPAVSIMIFSRMFQNKLKQNVL